MANKAEVCLTCGGAASTTRPGWEIVQCCARRFSGAADKLSLERSTRSVKSLQIPKVKADCSDHFKPQAELCFGEM